MMGSGLRGWLVSGWLGAVLCVVAGFGPARAQDASELIVRLNRLEGQIRQLSGQVEQLGYENRQLKEQLRKFAEDVEFRFQEQKGSRAAPPAAAKPERPGRRSDAFDADGAAAAPGAPKPLGTAKAGGDGIAAIIDGERGGGGAPAQLGPAGAGGAGPQAAPAE